MRARTPFILATAAALALAAAPVRDADPEPGPGYVATDGIEYIATIPINADSAGARLVGDRFYITEDRGLSIWDVSNPELPMLVGLLPLPQTPYVTEEDLDTNGEIAIVGAFRTHNPGTSGLTGTLYVIDVSDPSMPTVIGSLPGTDAHTWSCIEDCTYAYGSDGKIVDITDPTSPKLLPRTWLSATGTGAGHDVTQVAPGRAITSTNPIAYLDVSNPAEPRLLSKGSLPDNRLVHGNVWPNAGTDPLLLVGGETSKLGGACGPNDGAFMTFDASDVLAADAAEAAGEPRPEASFQLLSQWRVSGGGTYLDGNPPYDQFCAHWFQPHPTFDGAGLVAMGWYEHGVRFLEVAADGSVEEVEFFVPLGGSTSAAYWITDEIVYTADYQRGIDIIRYVGSE